MGGPRGRRDNRRCATEVEVGPNYAHSRRLHGSLGHGHDCRASRNYDEQPTRGEGRDEGVYERGGHAESDHDKETYEWDDDRVHGTGVLTRTGGGEYPGQYDDNVEECCDTEGEDYHPPTRVGGAEQVPNDHA